MYFALRNIHIGIDLPGLDHTVGERASEGLLAIFSFLLGLELNTEFVDGELHNLKEAMLPIVAAFGGEGAALTYVAVNRLNSARPFAIDG